MSLSERIQNVYSLSTPPDSTKRSFAIVMLVVRLEIPHPEALPVAQETAYLSTLVPLSSGASQAIETLPFSPITTTRLVGALRYGAGVGVGSGVGVGVGVGSGVGVHVAEGVPGATSASKLL